MTDNSAQRYLRPTGIDTVFNWVMGALTRAGVSLFGSRVLAVRGRKSGEWRTNPVNPLALDGKRYLVAPRGHAEWVRNLRVVGGGELRIGKKMEPFTATELDDAEKPPLLRSYLAKWGWEVGRFVEGLTKDSTDEELLAASPGIPVFRID